MTTTYQKRREHYADIRSFSTAIFDVKREWHTIYKPLGGKCAPQKFYTREVIMDNTSQFCLGCRQLKEHSPYHYKKNKTLDTLQIHILS